MSTNPEPPQKTYPTTWSPPNNSCMLTVDLENDCGGRVGPRFDTITESNVRLLAEFIRSHEIPATFFVTAKIFEEKKREVELLQTCLDRVEFGVHSCSHPNLLDDYEDVIVRACSAYEHFFGRAPAGYLAPQGRIK